MKVIEVKNLTKKYANKLAVDEINLNVEEGEFYGFIGPNASGKSTTINSMLNFIFPTKGEIKIFGLDSIKDTKEIKSKVGYVPSEVFYDEGMKVIDVLNYTLSYFNEIPKSEITKYAKLFDLDLNKKMSELSLGTKKKVAIIQAIIFKPKLLLLDEPTNGLDPIVQNKLFEVLADLRKNGTTIFMSSHDLNEVQKYCSRVAIIREGRIIKEDKIENLISENKKIINLKVNNVEEVMGILKNNNITDIEILSNNSISLKFSKNINELIKILSKIEIEDIHIYDVNLEEIFKSYYKAEVK